MNKKIVIGTRGSQLALWQANHIASCIKSFHSSAEVDLKVIKTSGDKIQDVPLAKVGGKGLFVKEIEEALLRGDVDIAVHSMKDVPAVLPDGLVIYAVPEREDPRDILISPSGKKLEDFSQGAVIGTCSLRRESQLRNKFDCFTVKMLRGNLDTRIRKVEEGMYDGIILAASGVKRLGWGDKITQFIPEEIMLPAVGQGALGIEVKESNELAKSLIDCLEHKESHEAVLGERGFLRKLEGGCQVPIACFGNISDGKISLTGLVASIDGKNIIKESCSGDAAGAAALGESLAETLLEKGAGEILKSVYQ